MASSENSSQPAVDSSPAGGTGCAHVDSSTQGTSTGTQPSASESVRVQASRKRRLTSEVWNEFTKEFREGKWQAECMYCKKWLSAASTYGTKHLSNHLLSCPAKSAPVGLKQQKLRMTKGPGGSVNLDNNGIFNQEVARKELALMISVHEYPLSMVDHVLFRKFCKSLQPLFKMVSRNTIRKDILLMHAAQKEKMVKYFANFKNRVAITSEVSYFATNGS